MPLRFFSFFSSAQPGADGLTQPQREAIADMLHFLTYADGHIASREGEFIDQSIAALSWDSTIAFSDFEMRSITDARRAREDAEFRKTFLASLGKRINSPEARTRAVALARSLIWADGTCTAKESLALANIEAALRD